MSGTIPLPARTDVAGLAADAVGAVTSALAALTGTPPAPLDPDRVAVAYASERYLRIDGAVPTAFAELSGFFTSADGWVRTHGNYPHHAAALRRGLGLDPAAGRDAVTAALTLRRSADAASAITAAGGLCVVVRAEDAAADAALRADPLVRETRLGDAPSAPLPSGSPSAPLAGIRVLDLTRVIAGPVGTRTLALLGADVLRLDPPQLPEIPAQHLDTGHGKRSALLDLRSRAGAARFDELLATADVVALGYRPAALDALGLSPAALAARRPGLVVVRHAAWPDPAARGFDSLVQAACGIAMIEGSHEAPGALPAQALDHSTGYLLAAAAMRLLHRRAREGGSWLAETSLRRVAADLLGLPRTPEPEPAATVADPAAHVQRFTVDGHALTTAAPAFAFSREPALFAAPRPWGADEPAWPA